MKFLKRLLVISGIVVIALILGIMIISIAFSNQIRQVAIDALNRQLATKVVVNGPIDFSLLAHFPYASVNFNQVTIEESFPEKKPFVQAEEISMLFSIWSIFSHSYEIRKIVIENGAVYIHLDSGGNSNYAIFKSSGSTASNFHLQIENALLNNLDVHYDDDQINHHYSFHINQSVLHGNFSSQNFVLSIQSNLLCHHLLIDSSDYISEKDLELDGDLRVDLAQQVYAFNHFQISAEKNNFQLDGMIQSTSEGSSLDLQWSGNDLQLQNILALLPQRFQPDLHGISSGGNVTFSGKISGKNTHTENPLVAFHIAVKNGMLESSKPNGTVHDIDVQADFDNGSSHSWNSCQLAVNSFSAMMAGNSLDGNFQIQNFNDPQVILNLNGKADLKQLLPFLPAGWITAAQGTIDFQHVYYRGALNNHEHAIAQNFIHAGGEFNLDHVSLELPDVTFNDISGTLHFHDNGVDISSFHVMAGKSDLRIDGSALNFIPFLVAQFSSGKKNIPQLGMNVTLTSEHLNWNDFLKRSSSEAADTSAFYAIPPVFYWLTGNVSASINDFQYDHFHATNVRGAAYFLNNHIYFNNVSLNAENGTASFNGDLDMRDRYHNHLQMTAGLQGIDIAQLFSECKDFGQTALTHENLSGSLTCQVSLKSSWDGQRLNLKTLKALAAISVENGELKNFDPMMALATFVRVNDLRDIHFSKLSNEIDIENETVYIPTMSIFSNVLNVELSGTHNFENVIDYNIQLNLLKLLSERFKRSQPANENVSEESTEGFLNLFLTMKGPAGNPKIQYDRKAVGQKISKDLANEKQNLKNTLSKEFDANQRSDQNVKDWKSPSSPQFMEFENDSTTLQSDSMAQPKKPLSLKKLFQPKPPQQ